jgi:hypothetical protein
MRVDGRAPEGAQCALHVDRPGVRVCGRCGSFMCVECAEGGLAQLCPSCRALGTAGEFPFSRDNFDFSRLFSHAFAAFQREWVLLSVAVLIYLAVLMAGGVVVSVINTVVIRGLGLGSDPSQPFTVFRELAVSIALSQTVGLVVNLVIQGVAVLGLYRLLIDVLLGRRAELARLFSQLAKLGRYVVATLLVFILTTVPIFVLLGAFAGFVAGSIGLGVLKDLQFEGAAQYVTPAVVLGLLATLGAVLVYALVLLPVTLFVPAELAVSEASPLEAISRAWRLASGNRLAVVGYGLFAGLVTLVGTLVCCVGLIPAMALGYLVTLSLFLALRSSSGLAPMSEG